MTQLKAGITKPRTLAAMRRVRPNDPAAASLEVRRGRPPNRAFINVLVRTSTRSALTRLKGITGLPSQGEVIDQMVEEVMRSMARVR